MSFLRQNIVGELRLWMLFRISLVYKRINCDILVVGEM